MRPHFTKPYIYFLGSHTGCSCGFQYGVGGDDDAAGRESVRQLGAYLADAVADVGAVELYACWNGDEAEAEVEHATMSPAAFSGDGDEFHLTERWFAGVERLP